MSPKNSKGVKVRMTPKKSDRTPTKSPAKSAASKSDEQKSKERKVLQEKVWVVWFKGAIFFLGCVHLPIRYYIYITITVIFSALF